MIHIQNLFCSNIKVKVIIYSGIQFNKIKFNKCILFLIKNKKQFLKMVFHYFTLFEYYDRGKLNNFNIIK